jgi:hypothetical protein
MGGLLATAYDQLQLIIYVYIVFSYLTLKFSDLLIRGKSALYISAHKFKGGRSCFGTTNHTMTMKEGEIAPLDASFPMMRVLSDRRLELGFGLRLINSF